MNLFSHPEFDNHEQVAFFRDAKTGLKAIVAIHNTNLGPSLGGCRMWPYANDADALTDVLRLSRGMTYKSALAGLPLGGGKCVIIGDPRKDKSEALLQRLGEFIEGLSGAYITAEDSGTSVADMAVIGQRTRFAAGVVEGAEHGGDPSPSTAYTTFVGLKTAVRQRLGRNDLNGLTVALQGVGNVGYYLARHLHQAGAKLIVTDIVQANLQRAVDEFGARVVAPELVFGVDADVFAPCAMGGVINEHTLPQLKCAVIAGAANNQLATPDFGELLLRKEILYTPDYVLNAGGIIDIAYQRSGEGAEALQQHLDSIGLRLVQIFERAAAQGLPPHVVADQLAEETFNPHA